MEYTTQWYGKYYYSQTYTNGHLSSMALVHYVYSLLFQPLYNIIKLYCQWVLNKVE